MIKIQGLNKYYNKGKSNQIHVINDTTLELPESGLISFLGKSGSGKTTLLNVIGGLDKAKGTIYFDDLCIKNYNMYKIDKYRKNNIGYIFQNYSLLNNKTVYENLEIALKIIGIIDKTEVEKRIEFALKSVGMYKYRKKQAYALSGGQMQRVAIARALIKDSKVIIADEPTGNLDSENTIEVMNILKKISFSRLVLLVTHDVKIAEFYSDQIIKIKDGKISDNYTNTTTKLSVNNANTVYLKDMYLKENKSDIGNIRLYTETDNFESNIDIDIIVRNGNIYLQSNQNIKLVENSNLKVVDDHYKDLDLSYFEDISYDNSWFSNSKPNLKEKIIQFLASIKTSFLNFRNVGKKMKMLYGGFVLMGCLLGAAIICLVNFSIPDDSNFIYADDYYTLGSKDHTFNQDPTENLKLNYTNGSIDNITINNSAVTLVWTHHYTYVKNINLKLNLLVARFSSKVDSNLLVGNAPKTKNEIVIDFQTAKDICNVYGNRSKYNDLLGKKVRLSYLSSYMEVTIVGVCEGSQRVAYGNQEFYTNWASPGNILYFGERRYFLNERDKDNNALYDIVSGRDLNTLEQTGNREVLVHYLSEDALEPSLVIDNLEYKIVGTFKHKDGIYDGTITEIITNVPSKNIYKGYMNLALNEDEYYLVEGRNPVGLKECIVSTYINKSIGDVFDGKVIVGKYTGTTKALSTFCVVDLDTYILSNYGYGEISFTIREKSALILDEKEEMISLYDKQARIAQEEQVSNLKLFELLSFILLIVSSVFIYLVTRSKMLSDIYNIGVYRCLGSTRKNIISEFLFDLFTLTTFTTIIGYLVILFLYNYLAGSINNLIGQTMFKINNLYSLGGIPFVYLINLSIGIIPVILLTKKTPSEICSKYDI